MRPSSVPATASARSLRRLAGALLALAVVPALVFAAFQVFAQAESEALLARVREEQLSSILFAVNQHAWEVADVWAGRLARVPVEQPRGPAGLDPSALEAFMRSAPPVQDVLSGDTALTSVFSREAHSRATLDAQEAARGLPMWPTEHAGVRAFQTALTPARLGRLLDQYRQGYRRLDPVPLSRDRLALAFIADGPAPGAPPRVLGLVLEPRPFVERVVMPKLREVSQGGLEFGVFLQGRDEPLVRTGTLRRGDVERARPLWILPGYTLGVRPSQSSAEAVLRRRLTQSLLLIGSVTVLLVLGGWLTWRSARREVALAQLKEDFVSNVSHELRTPLALIRLYAETLAEGRVASEERRRQYYATLVAESERLSRLVGNVLHFSRMDRGPQDISTASLALSSLVAEVGERYRPVLERAGVTLGLDLAPDLPPINGDRDALSEALVNLLDNAAKYGAAGGEVHLRTRAEGAHVVVEVADRGPGVPEAMRDRVFEPFVRVQAESTDGLAHTAKGTGLGLAIVRRVATAHGGTVSVDAREGGGAVFRLALPTATTPSTP
ncbi:MAG TPA: HAMP domain-containing sensor histidine kinase [Rhodothermales bacterium]|nr:HAMP domain-containing sensor histidine kinase [Rhodothermales bacterium]